MNTSSASSELTTLDVFAEYMKHFRGAKRISEKTSFVRGIVLAVAKVPERVLARMCLILKSAENSKSHADRILYCWIFAAVLFSNHHILKGIPENACNFVLRWLVAISKKAEGTDGILECLQIRRHLEVASRGFYWEKETAILKNADVEFEKVLVLKGLSPFQNSTAFCNMMQSKTTFEDFYPHNGDKSFKLIDINAAELPLLFRKAVNYLAESQEEEGRTSSNYVKRSEETKPVLSFKDLKIRIVKEIEKHRSESVGASRASCSVPNPGQANKEEKKLQKKYLKRLKHSCDSSKRVRYANRLLGLLEKSEYVSDRLNDILSFGSKMKKLQLMEGRLTLLWIHVTALFLCKKQAIQAKDSILSDILHQLFTLVEVAGHNNSVSGRVEFKNLCFEVVTLRRHLEAAMDGWWECTTTFQSLLNRSDEKLLQLLKRANGINVLQLISEMELKPNYKSFHPTTKKCSIIKLTQDKLPQLKNKDSFDNGNFEEIIHASTSTCETIQAQILWEFASCFNIFSVEENEKQLCQYLLAVLWTYIEIAHKCKVQRKEFEENCVPFGVLLGKVPASTFTPDHLQELTAIRQHITHLIFGSWTQQSKFDEILTGKGLNINLSNVEKTSPAKSLLEFYEGNPEPDKLTLLRLTAKLKVAAVRHVEVITGYNVRDSLAAEKLSKKIVTSLHREILKKYTKVHGKNFIENVKLMDDIISSHIANYQENSSSESEGESYKEGKSKEPGDFPLKKSKLKKLSYIEKIGTEIYEACEKESLQSDLGNKIRILVIVITEELQRLKWDGTENHVEGCKRIKSLLKTFRDIPAWGSKARKYTLIVLWIYLGVVQSYNVTKGAWGQHWSILGSLVKRHFDSSSQNRNYSEEMKTVRQYFNLTVPQSTDKLNSWLKKSFPNVEWTKKGTEFPGRKFETFYGFDKDRTAHFFAIEGQAAKMAAETSDRSFTDGDGAAQGSTLQRWIERVLWRNVSAFRNTDKTSFLEAAKNVKEIITDLLRNNKGSVESLLRQEEERWESPNPNVWTQKEIEEKSLLPPLDETLPFKSSDPADRIGQSIKPEYLIQNVETEEVYKTVLPEEFSIHDYVEHLLSPTLYSHTVTKEHEKLSVVFRHSYSSNSCKSQEEESTTQSKGKYCSRKRLSKSSCENGMSRKRLSKQFIL